MSKRVFTVLAIDGGGVKGIIPARVLQEIEERTGKPVCELFDLVAGTSTGAIVAGGMITPSDDDPKKPKYSAKDILQTYIDHAEKIFPEKKFRDFLDMMPGTNGFYDGKYFEKVLEDYFGDTKFKDTLTHLMMAGADMKNFEPVWMHYFLDRKKSVPQRWESLKVKDAIRASASAPTFFEAKYIYTHPNKHAPDAAERHAMLDGSLFASTIARRAYTQAKKLAPPDAEIVIVHLGTGMSEASLTPDEMNKKNQLDWVRSHQGISILGASFELTAKDIENDLREELGDNLYRLNRMFNKENPENPDTRLDNSRASNLKKLIKFAEDMIEENDETLDRLCEILQHRIHIEKQHECSRKSLGALSDKITETKSTKSLGQLYTKIVKYSSDLEGIKIPDKDQDLFDTCQSLSDRHKTQLNNIYTAHHNELIDIEKQKKRGIGRFFNWFGKKSKNKEPSNDDRPDNTPIKKDAPKKRHP